MGYLRDQGNMVYLVAITPEEVLGADVLVRVLRLVRGGFVGLVLPMGVPSKLGVNASDDEAGNGDADGMLAIFGKLSGSQNREMAMPGMSHRFRDYADGCSRSYDICRGEG
jgi:hypothetical protein